MEKSFPELKIDGSFISELTVTPAKELRMILFHGPRSENENQVSLAYDLRFNGIQNFILNVQAEPWLEIISHNLFSKSEYLTNCLSIHPEGEKGILENNRELNHFQFICDEGHIDVIAKDFTLYLINEIPHFSSLPSKENEETDACIQTGGNDFVDPGVKCSFCGKEQSEVSKIVTGRIANICNECVVTCSELMDK